MALRTSSSAVEASAISPLRTPRERDWPRPMTFNAPAALTSPTAAQILDVPISSPTMSEAGSNIFFAVAVVGFYLRAGRRGCARLQPGGGYIIGERKVQGVNGPAQFLSPIKNLAPAAELPVQIPGGKSNPAALPGGDLKNFR